MELWNWEDLLISIQETYLNGENYLSFYSDVQDNEGELIFEFDSYESAHAKTADELMKVSYDVTNNTNKYIFKYVLASNLITKDKIQVEAISMDAQKFRR